MFSKTQKQAVVLAGCSRGAIGAIPIGLQSWSTRLKKPAQHFQVNP